MPQPYLAGAKTAKCACTLPEGLDIFEQVCYTVTIEVLAHLTVKCTTVDNLLRINLVSRPDKI